MVIHSYQSTPVRIMLDNPITTQSRSQARKGSSNNNRGASRRPQGANGNLSKGPSNTGKNANKKRGKFRAVTSQNQAPSSSSSSTSSVQSLQPPQTSETPSKPSTEDKRKALRTSLENIGPEPRGECIICCESIRMYAIGECNHRAVCDLCTLRRREVYNERDCPICKKKLDTMIFTRSKIQEYQTFDQSTLHRSTLRPDMGLFADRQHMIECERLWDFQCPACDKPAFNDINALKAHLKSVHSLHYCEQCLQHRKVWLRDQEVYSAEGMQQHLIGLDRREMEAHQLCEFCNNMFYDKDALFVHLTRTHFTCHICEKDGILYQYFKNYPSLERHFRKEHYLCEELDCLEKKFVVFRTELDIKGHEVTVHVPNRKFKTKAEERMARTVDPRLFFASSSNADGHLQGVVMNAPTERTRNAPRGRGGRKDRNPQQQQQRQQQREMKEQQQQHREQVSIDNEEERKRRNRALVEKIRECLGTEERFAAFRKLSTDLRTWRVTPAQYHQRLIAALGRKKAEELFPELVDLLPDPVLKMALLTVHQNYKDFPPPPEYEIEGLKGFVLEEEPVENFQEPTVVEEFPPLPQTTPEDFQAHFNDEDETEEVPRADRFHALGNGGRKKRKKKKEVLVLRFG